MGFLENIFGTVETAVLWLAALAVGCVLVFQLHQTVRKVNIAAESFGQEPYSFFSYCQEYLRGILGFNGVLAEYYARTNGARPFIVPNPMFGPIVMVTAQQVASYRFVSDSELNAETALHKILQARFTLPDETWDSGHSFHPMHLRKYLQKSLGPSTPDLAVEVNLAMKHFWETNPDQEGWVEVELLSSILKIVTQEVNKMYIGEAIGRDETYIDAVIGLATSVLTCGLTLNLVPLTLKRMASTVICWPAQYRRRILVNRFLRDIVHRRKMSLEGNTSEKESDNPEFYEDYCMALLGAARKDKNPAYYETENFISRFMTHYIAAVYATSTTFLGVVEKLLQNPNVLVLLRNEANSVLGGLEGPSSWKKTDIDRLDVHDSFIRECMRTTPVAFATMRRSAIKPEGYQFADGTFVPSDFEVGVPVDQLHHDERYYKSARQFDPLRFMATSNMPMKEEVNARIEGQKEQLASTTTSFLAWGDGTHACIGRFLAANILKTTLASMVMNYDIEPAANFSSKRQSFGIMNVPNRVSRVRFRRVQR